MKRQEAVSSMRTLRSSQGDKMKRNRRILYSLRRSIRIETRLELVVGEDENLGSG